MPENIYLTSYMNNESCSLVAIARQDKGLLDFVSIGQTFTAANFVLAALDENFLKLFIGHFSVEQQLFPDYTFASIASSHQKWSMVGTKLVHQTKIDIKIVLPDQI